MTRSFSAFVALLFAAVFAQAQVPPATPATQQAALNAIPFTNGRGLVTGAQVQSSFQIVHDILSGMGTWDASGNYTPKNAAPPHVANAAALAAWTNYAFPVRRDGFSAAGDLGAATFVHSNTACSLNSGNGDGGSQVKAGDGGCWLTAETILVAQQFNVKGDGSTDDGAALQAWANATLALKLPGRLPSTANGYHSNATLLLSPGMVIEADKGAVINNGGTAQIGVTMTAGNYSAADRMQLPALGNFPTGLNMAGASLARVRVPYIGGSNKAIVMTSSGGSILDSVVEIDAIFSSTYGYAINCESANDVIQGNRVEVNFMTETQKPFAYTGTTCSDDGNTLQAYAVDITPDKGGGAAISNEQSSSSNANGNTVPRATFRVTDWFGGDGFGTSATGGAAQLVKGNFLQLTLDVQSTRQWLAANQMQASTMCVACETKFHQATSVNSTITMDTSGSLSSSFNGGQPVISDSFLTTLTTGTDLGQNNIYDGFVYVGFPDIYTHPWSCHPAQSLTALALVGFLDEDQQTTGRIRLRFTPYGTTVVPKGSTMVLRCERKVAN